MRKSERIQSKQKELQRDQDDNSNSDNGFSEGILNRVDIVTDEGNNDSKEEDVVVAIEDDKEVVCSIDTCLSQPELECCLAHTARKRQTDNYDHDRVTVTVTRTAKSFSWS